MTADSLRKDLSSLASLPLNSIVLTPHEDTALRLTAALVVGTVIGLNRELHGKPAGLRTHALVTLCAAIATEFQLRAPDA